MLTVWRAIPRCTRCQKPTLWPAGMRRLPMRFDFVLSFRPPFRIRPRCVIAMTWYKSFSRACRHLNHALGNTGCNYPQLLARTTCQPCGSFSMRSPNPLPTVWKFAIRTSLPKGETEQRFNRGLHERRVNRVILDSRPVHAAIPHTEAIRDAQRKKPKVPVHAVVTANHPMVRFIGSDNMAQNSALFAVWLTKLSQWQQTTTPYLFLHTPDIAQAPELVDTLWANLRSALPEIGSAPSIPQQSSLF